MVTDTKAEPKALEGALSAVEDEAAKVGTAEAEAKAAADAEAEAKAKAEAEAKVEAETPYEKYAQAKLDQERERLETEAEAKAEAKAAKSEADSVARQTESARQDRLRNALPSARQSIITKLTTSEYGVSQADAEAILGPLDTLVSEIREIGLATALGDIGTAQQQAALALTETFLSTLPESDRDPFVKKAGTSWQSWFKARDEVMAPRTAWARETAAAHKLAVAKADVDGFERGKLVPAGQPRGATEGSSGAGSTWRTKEDARNLHANGKLSDAEMRRINADSSIPEGYGA